MDSREVCFLRKPPAHFSRKCASPKLKPPRSSPSQNDDVVMQTLHIASVEGANVEQPRGEFISASRPINIASVRATSLRSSGLRAASSRRGTDAQTENQSAVTAAVTETGTIVNQLNCSSSSLSMTSSTQLSYTNSQDPGEDSQLNAIAMVDKLVNFNASIMWQKPQSNIVAEQFCVKGPQSNKGIQSLAHNADMKNLQDKMGIYDWIDSQPDKNGDLEQVFPTSKGQQKQLDAVTPAKNRKVRQGMVSDLVGVNDTNIALELAEEASPVKQQNIGSSLCQPISADVSNKLHDTDASYDKGEAEMPIGANTQIALEAMDIMRCGIQLNHGSAPHNEKAMFDIGTDTQTAIDAIETMLNSENAPPNEEGVSSLFDIGNDTQTAIDAIDSMKTDVGLSKVKAKSPLFDIGNDTQTAIVAMDIMRRGVDTDIVLLKKKATTSLFDIGNDTQTAIDAIASMKQGTETDVSLSKVERREEIERRLRVQNSGGDVKKHASGGNLDAKRNLSPVTSILGKKRGLLSNTPTVVKPVGKKGSPKEMSKTLKRQRSALFNPPAWPVCNSSRRFLLDFLRAMVPRRKRSRLCALQGTVNEDVEVFGCQKRDFHVHKPLTKADKQSQPGKPGSSEIRKSALWPKQDGNSPEIAVLKESTNGKLVRRTKKKISTESDCHTTLQQSRKRRKCESRCIFVLFSHSLSEATINQQKKMLIKLGGHVASSAAKATHFVADSFTRSRNMLEIMAAGKVVVTTMWLEGCSQAEYFVDENSYILQDVQKEKQWGFCMLSSLAASRRKPLFEGMKVVVSPTTVPDFEAIKAVIECAGGQALQKLSSFPHSKADEMTSVSFVVGSEKDYDFCVEFLKKGCKVYSTELILQGVVTQNLDLSRNRLFEDHMW